MAWRTVGKIREGFRSSNGRTFVTYDAQRQRTALRLLVLRREPTRSVIRTIRERGGLTRPMFAQMLQSVAPLSWSTALRRAQTMSLWFVTLELLCRRSGVLVYSGPNLAAEVRSSAEFLQSSFSD